jgi:DNA-binding HxlR family transcriptional regulator/predicted transcriptional regulator
MRTEKMIESSLLSSKNGQKYSDLVETLKALGAECRSCTPLSPLECVSRCNLWKVKNELRQLRETMDDPCFIKDLINVLKNNTRLHILRTIMNGRYSVAKLQEQLKKQGYIHSQDSLSQEYLRPLLRVGLAAESQDHYYATTFGSRLGEIVPDFAGIIDVLPARSECYEETVLDSLLSGPKSFEDLDVFLSPQIASRILKRLKSVDLIDAPEERDYVFFFRSKRDPGKESLSETEARVYSVLSEEGISANKLATKTGLSLRRTYKCLRGLKGKKLVFTRKNPRTYKLTEKGEKLGSLLKALQDLVGEVWQSSWHVSAEKS